MEQETRLSESPSAVPGTVRPGGRTAKVRRAVLDATEDALAAAAFHTLNMDQIAASAGVGKTTVYRRWGSPSASSPTSCTTWRSSPCPPPTPAASRATCGPTRSSCTGPSPTRGWAPSSAP